MITFLKDMSESKKGIVVGRFVKLDMISTICNIMQTSNEDFVKYVIHSLTLALNFISYISTIEKTRALNCNSVHSVVLECFDLISSHKEFYDNHAAVDATESMIKLSYLVSKSRKDSTQFEKLLHSICNILVR